MWQTLVIDNDYEIYNEYPNPIRRKGSDRLVKERVNRDGYIHLKLNQKTFKKHRVIAIQFIDNPNNYDVVDHINRNRSDNRIDNLHWVSRTDNNRNKTSNKGVMYEFVSELPLTAKAFENYNQHTFTNYYFDKDSQNMYYYNGNEYRVMHKQIDKNRQRYSCMNNEGKRAYIELSKLNRLF